MNIPKKRPLTYTEVREILESNSLLLKTNLLLNDTREGFFSNNSKNINPSDIFLAYKGTGVDGHNFIKNALECGAKLVILEDPKYIANLEALNESYLLVPDSRVAWSLLCARSFNNPEEKLKFIGVTGTNGKSSTTHMAYNLFSKNIKAMLIGTLGAFFEGVTIPLNHTTPDPDDFYSLLSQAVSMNISWIIMEVSSHSLAFGKLHGIFFDIIAYTSFSQDHLDFHNSMEDYWNAKKLLLTKYLKPDGICFSHISLLSKFGKSIDNLIYYGKKNQLTDPLNQAGYEISFENLSQTKVAVFYNNFKKTVQIPYIGDHNVENFLCAFLLTAAAYSKTDKKLTRVFPIAHKSAALNLEKSLEELFKYLESELKTNTENNEVDFLKLSCLKNIPGRLENVENEEGLHIFVDFAHSPQALEFTLRLLRQRTKGRLIVVFGCGGQRDPLKRPIMAKVCEEFCDKIIVTSDNPRLENQNIIFSHIMAGFSNFKKVTVVLDRREAIFIALGQLTTSDTLAICGKGHESYQIIGNEKLEFSDTLVTKNLLEALKTGTLSTKDELTTKTGFTKTTSIGTESFMDLNKFNKETLTKDTLAKDTLAKEDFYKKALDGLLVGEIIKVPLPNPNFITTDSRNLLLGSNFFIPLEGENFDGHKFLNTVLENSKNVALCSSSKKHLVKEAFWPQVIFVSDTLLAFQKIAAAWRSDFKDLKLAALTGSNGKTTTKTLIGLALEQYYKVTLPYSENWNNEIGVPKTLCLLTPSIKAGILEFGARHIGNIKELVELAKPNVVACLNVGEAHIGEFGGLENIYTTKTEIIDYSPKDAVFITNYDDEKLLEKAKKSSRNFFTFGKKEGSSVQILANTPTAQGSILKFSYFGEIITISTKIYHQSLDKNIAAALCILKYLEVPIATSLEAFSNYNGVLGRFKIHKQTHRTIIDDTYNANPKSMEEGLMSLSGQFSKEKKTLILGDMLELGEKSPFYHQELGVLAASLKPLLLIAIGPMSKYIIKGALSAGLSEEKTLHLESVSDLLKDLSQIPKDSEVIYAKASNGIKLSFLIKQLLLENNHAL